MKYSLVLQSFGREEEYRRAIFCLLSHHYHATPASIERTILFTDNWNFFVPYLKDINVHCISLTSEKIRAMRGDIDFLHRMKIAMIEEAFQITDGNLLYIDSDTFFIGSPEGAMKEVSRSCSFMHKVEYSFESLKDMPLPAGVPFRAYYELITKRQFALSSGAPIRILADYFSWNAGAMAFHQSHQSLLKDVYALTDQFYPATQNHASEQYAFSVIFQTNTTVKPLEKIIYHYWYRVKKNVMDDMLENIINASFQRLHQTVKRKTILDLSFQLPHLLETNILTLRDNAIQAFHENKFSEGFKFSVQALLKNPFDRKFAMDIGYHFKRWIILHSAK